MTDEQLQNLSEVLTELDGEPLFHMSLGSKELFHSNFLAWFVLKFPGQAAAAFAPWLAAGDRADEVRVLREKRHLDLIIEFPQYEPLLIENKVFSLPDERQLDYYAEAVIKVRGRPTLILLSLTNPAWPQDMYRSGELAWRYVSYAELRSRLAGQIDAVRGDDPYAGETLQHYSTFLGLLVRMQELVSVRSEDEPLELANAARAELQRIRMYGAAQKIRARQTLQVLRRRLDDIGVDHKKLNIGSGFTNGRSILEAFYDVRPDVLLGWQLQANQWRLAMILKSLRGRGEQARAKREAYARQHEEWFNFDIFERMAAARGHQLPQLKTGKRAFNHYDPDFIYRYRAPANLTVGDVVELGVSYIGRAQALGEKHVTR